MSPRAFKAGNFQWAIFSKVALSDANKTATLFFQAFSSCCVVGHNMATCCRMWLLAECATSCT